MKRFICILILLLISPVLAQENPALLLFVRGDLDSTISLYVLNADTGEERFLRDLSRGDGPNGHDFGWSPNGRIWIIERDDTGGAQLSFMDAESSEESSFGESLGGRTCASAVEWSPNGRYMSYVTDSNDNEEGLSIYDSQSESSYTLPWIGQHFPYWSPTGNTMLIFDNYFADDRENPAKTRLLNSEDGSELLRRGTDVNAFNFAFSPDGQFFAYDETESIWFYEIETGEKTNLNVSASFMSWSPDSRYLLLESSVYEPALNVSHSYYDRQTGQISPINLSGNTGFLAWGNDESQLFLAHNFELIAERLYPQSLVSYNMATGESEALMQADAESWISSPYQLGDWLVVMHLSLANTAELNWIPSLRLSNGDTMLDLDLTVDSLSLSPSPDETWLSIKDQNNAYIFDASRAALERLPIAEISPDAPFWSPDSRYLAFQSGEQIALWNSESGGLELLSEGITKIIGWQHGELQTSLVCLNGYSDGDA